MKIFTVLKDKGIGIIIIIMIVYIGIIFYSDISKISATFFEIRYEFVGIILSLELISLMLRSYRQKKFLESSDIKLSFLANFKICLIGMAMLVTPGGAGMLIKSHFLKKKFGLSISKTAPTVFAERYHDFLALTTILIFSLIFTFTIEAAISGVIAFVLLIIVYIIFTNNKWLKKIEEKIRKIKFFKNSFPANLEITNSVNSLKTRNSMISGWLISTILWSIDAIAIYFGFVAFNLEIGIFEAVQIFFTALMYGTISFLPAGIGVTEGVFIGLLLSNNLELSIATSLILFIRLTTIWFYTFLGFIALKLTIKR